LIRCWTDPNDSSSKLRSTPGWFDRKIDLFHCQMQFAAEGTLEEIDAPAPSSSIWPTCALTVTDGTKASSARKFAPGVAVGFAALAGRCV